jgi:Protein of unknown function (DUF2586)
MSAPGVTITIQDGGANTTIEVPAANMRAKIGVLLSATAAYAASGLNPTAVVNQIVAVTQAPSLVPYFIGGKLMESAGLVCAGGGVALAIGIPLVTAGTAKAVQATVPGGSTSTITTTLDATNGAWDDYYVKIKCTTGGTRGTTGIFFQVSLDRGANFGPVIALGTATTYIIPNTGIQINFGVGALVAGDYWQFQTIGPSGNTAGYSAALTALRASAYAQAGFGGTHLAEVVNGATATTLQSYLGGSPDGTGGLAASYCYTRMQVDVRDAIAPAAWGGSGETEAAWMTSIETDYSATTAVRVSAAAGFYNMPSAYPNPAAGTPAYRRCCSWAIDPRLAVIPTQRMPGRVSDGALGAIVVNPTTDPTDGFIYHNEALNPGLTAARFSTLTTYIGKTGYFSQLANLMCPTGSVYQWIARGAVMDVGCFIVYQEAIENIESDVRLLPNGTLYPADRLTLQAQALQGINANMTNVGMLSPGSTVTIDPNANVGATNLVPYSVSLAGKGYILNETINIGFSAPSAAGG